MTRALAPEQQRRLLEADLDDLKLELELLEAKVAELRGRRNARILALAALPQTIRPSFGSIARRSGVSKAYILQKLVG